MAQLWKGFAKHGRRAVPRSEVGSLELLGVDRREEAADGGREAGADGATSGEDEAEAAPARRGGTTRAVAAREVATHAGQGDSCCEDQVSEAFSEFEFE